MPSRSLDFPVFDADNHMYETKEALTKFLPDRYKGAIDYVDVHGRTKIVVRGTISDYIPNPTFDVVAAPGAQEDYFRHGNPEGKSYRQIMGEPMRAIPAFREPEPRAELMDELGIDRASASSAASASGSVVRSSAALPRTPASSRALPACLTMPSSTTDS